jgi:hypothetical protein
MLATNTSPLRTRPILPVVRGRRSSGLAFPASDAPPAVAIRGRNRAEGATGCGSGAKSSIAPAPEVASLGQVVELVGACVLMVAVLAIALFL